MWFSYCINEKIIKCNAKTIGHTRKISTEEWGSVISSCQNDFHPVCRIWAYGGVTRLCAGCGEWSSSYRCVDCFFCTKCFGKLGNRIWNVFVLVGATQSRESTRNVLYSCREALKIQENLKNSSMAFYPCVSITIISKNIYNLEVMASWKLD